jgi:hypothetical protein
MCHLGSIHFTFSFGSSVFFQFSISFLLFFIQSLSLFNSFQFSVFHLKSVSIVFVQCLSMTFLFAFIWLDTFIWYLAFTWPSFGIFAWFSLVLFLFLFFQFVFIQVFFRFLLSVFLESRRGQPLVHVAVIPLLIARASCKVTGSSLSMAHASRLCLCREYRDRDNSNPEQDSSLNNSLKSKSRINPIPFFPNLFPMN